MKKYLYRLWLAVSLPCALNLILLWSRLGQTERFLQMPRAAGWIVCILAAGLWILTYWGIVLLPYRDSVRTGFRVRMMMGGRRSVYWGLYTMGVQALVFYLVYIRHPGISNYGVGVMVSNGVLAVLGSFLLLASGVLRIFFTSRRLSIARRLVMVLVMWIPFLNLAVLLYACRLVYEEYDFEREKVQLRELRVDSELCRTRYPLVMVHGIGFRDLRYFNYWGRIPRELMENGAVIYYGNQEALGTIACNAEDIRKKILQVMEETGCEKVNIIAHSKGGLDARYAISKLGMAPCVASLTTMNTPHHGCRFVDYACGLPEGLYRFVAGCFDRTFRKFGDRNPDFYTATHQFATEASEKFNEQIPDAPQVYYQSYASRMKHAWSHMLLSIPYCLIRLLEGENDGLVSTKSAVWGEFQGVFVNSHTRGISHGDIIDLKRQDYRGFDVLETYVQIVARLKEKGF